MPEFKDPFGLSSKKENEQKSLEKFVSWEESLHLAKELWAKYKDQIYANYEKDVDNLDDPLIPDYQKSTLLHLEKIPEEVQKHYWGHGVTRGDDFEIVASALNIMANKSIKGDTAPLVNKGWHDAWMNADFSVISKKDKELLIDGSEDFKHKTTKADIGAIIVDVKYYPMVEELKKLFPDVNIIKANQIPEYFGIINVVE